MKVLVISLSFLIFSDVESLQNTRFKSASAISLNSNLATVHYCYIKAYSRNYSTLNWGWTYHRPINKPFYITLIFEYKYGTIYRPVITSKPLEFCEMVEGKGTNVLMKMIINLIKDSVPDLIHKCPYVGRMDARNVSINDMNWMSTFPSGVYRITMNYSIPQSELLHLKFSIEIKSEIRTSFWFSEKSNNKSNKLNGFEFKTEILLLFSSSCYLFSYQC